MLGAEWVLFDTETTGLSPPIFTVEIAAQRMIGWERTGPPFRHLLNQNADISPEASRVHGYTREILERDGEDPRIVYGSFRRYVGDRPLVAYNLPFDLDQVLLPEWVRLGLEPIGERGFCALRLAQRLLDPVPAGNCKLQTLRQYYRLPERGAHTALGDVDTLVDLVQGVLRPLAEAKGFSSWARVCSFTEAEWFPSRIPFGKHKGRDYADALDDADLQGWLEWLARSSNQRSSRMGQWYLDQLRHSGSTTSDAIAPSPFARSDAPGVDATEQSVASRGAGLIIFVDQDHERLRGLIAYARARLADIQAEYMVDHAAVDATNAALFRLVREHYHKRDRLRLVIDYRRKFLDVLLEQGDEDAEHVTGDFKQARDKSDREYEEAAVSAAEKADLSEEEEAEIKALWGKLVRAYHPDRYVHEPDKQAIYERLTATINEARDTGNLAVLRAVAENPDAFIADQGWGALGINRDDDHEDMRKLYEAIEIEIVERLETLSKLRESPEYELMKACRAKPELLARVAQDQTTALVAEIAQLQAQADQLAVEIEELTGTDASIRA